MLRGKRRTVRQSEERKRLRVFLAGAVPGVQKTPTLHSGIGWGGDRALIFGPVRKPISSAEQGGKRIIFTGGGKETLTTTKEEGGKDLAAGEDKGSRARQKRESTLPSR